MAITLTLTALADGSGVDLDAYLAAQFDGFTPYQFPVFLAADAAETTQILHLDTPTAGAEADTRIVLLEGSDFTYTFSNHSVSGTIDQIRLGTLGAAWDDAASDLALDADGRVGEMGEVVTISNLGIVNAVGVKGDVHEIVSGMMGGGPDGLTADADPILAAIYGTAHELIGSTGHDRWTGTAFADVAFGGDGRDTLDGGDGADALSGGAWADLLLGGQGADTLRGQRGDDRLEGHKGYDLLFGNAGADTVLGGDGDDALYGGGDDDLLLGGQGADALYGGQGRDRLEGGKGYDMLSGGIGNDTLLGQLGQDTLYGGAGDDLLIGGAHDDVMTGGAGADTFRFLSLDEMQGDRITDFETGVDLLDVSAIDGLAFIGGAAFSGGAGELRAEVSGGQTLLLADLDGDGAADVQMALDGAPVLTADDFLV
ncbi:calcium-binding protein [Mesobacterium pallidum]|uniref:calcium-binding protein n=1 Tax=Mesobacterium pallidum TaxID=2872037 RepID=UPI001EE235CD|nr:calcium-binding protein [Mesobacterium pallidum]